MQVAFESLNVKFESNPNQSRAEQTRKLAKTGEIYGAASLAKVNKAIRWNAVWEKNRQGTGRERVHR
jgi:hypothetical protein